MIVLGLTGSIGMGKTTASGIFRRLGAPVFDADRCVHDLYEGPVVDRLESAFPGVRLNGRIDRNALGALILKNPDAMAQLESLVHPLVLEKRLEFLSKSKRLGARLVVLDLPLLFETASQNDVDGIVVVTTSIAVQKARVLARPGMSDEKLAAILGRQIPDTQKRKFAHFIIKSDDCLESMERQVKVVVSAVANCEYGN
ncbi:dephospho-CoA kinase [Rhodoblastus sp.]|uniref:dephospho-CoA kinase n=1 Tax=Rhodoblastus sp. TaxID=1962975 RepID=UPI003F9E3C0F